MKLARQKSCLQLPAGDAKPDDWPVGWEFPPESTWPPGYPKRMKGGVTLVSYYDAAHKTLYLHCLDEHNEDTDALLGHSFSVKAFSDGKAVRMRRNSGEVFSEYAIVKVQEFEQGKWGFAELLEFEGDGSVDVQMMLFGYDNTGALITAAV